MSANPDDGRLPVNAAPLPHSAAAERNQQPILDALRALLGERGAALEIASGTGQHVVRFAEEMPAWTWQPSDADAGMLWAIDQRAAQARRANVRPAMHLDVMSVPWRGGGAMGEHSLDVIYCANMIHIAPWAACEALMTGAARHLAPGGILITYGPYLEADVPTAPGNLAFDESLRQRDPAWGIRPREAVETEAARVGLRLRARHAMPANNLLLVFARA